MRSESGKTFIFEGAPERVDKFLSKQMSSFSRTYIQKLIKEGFVQVNGQKTSARYVLSLNDKIDVMFPKFSCLPTSAADSIPILFEDKHIIVVNKPADLVVHPAGPYQKDTLIQRLWPKLASGWENCVKNTSLSTARPGVVHRLDKGTSGVMVIAKTPQAADHLSAQFAKRTIVKIYQSLVWGMPETHAGHIRSMVGRSRQTPHRMSVQDQGRWSETAFTVLKRFPSAGKNGASLIEARPLTGRTHQIRVQLASLGHPLIGDVAYGAPKDNTQRPLLHALSLTFTHPHTRKKHTFEAPLPEDFEKFLSSL